jgi:hypothetical protein
LRKMKVRTLIVAVLIFLGVGAAPWMIPTVEALSWSTWNSGAVGDVWESVLANYWTIGSTPIQGYESYLWDTYFDVVESELDYYSNLPAPADKKLVFTTYSSASLMGVLEFESDAVITGTEKLVFRGRYGARFSYSGVRTLGYVQLYDKTSQTVKRNIPIKSGSTPNVWEWGDPFSFEEDLIKNHEYTIKLIARDVWIQQKVEVAWECAEVWFHAQDTDYGDPLDHGSHSWRYDWIFNWQL